MSGITKLNLKIHELLFGLLRETDPVSQGKFREL
jgi:hypothetical protein